jgi:hypothetical protein
MLFGPDQILRCPHCAALMRRRTIRSFGFGTGFEKRWSDGYTNAFPEDPEWAACPGCAATLYVPELEVVGRGMDDHYSLTGEQRREQELENIRARLSDDSLLTRWRRWRGKEPSLEQLRAREAELIAEVIPPEPPEIPGADDLPLVRGLGVEAMARLLEANAGTMDPETEVELRIQLWHTLNHPMRSNPEEKHALKELHLANLTRLTELMRDEQPHAIQVAILMELGCFEEAADLLVRIPVNEATNARRAKYQQAIAQRIDRVFVL